jgi:sec-independent protein translocase protein TatC
LVLPYATAFLLSFTDDVFVANIAAGPYFDFVTTMFLAFGLVMEFPILLVGLARAGILSSARLRASRRYVVLGIAIFAAVATPGGDLVSPLALGATMYLLFEATAFFIRRMGR